VLAELPELGTLKSPPSAALAGLHRIRAKAVSGMDGAALVADARRFVGRFTWPHSSRLVPTANSKHFINGCGRRQTRQSRPPCPHA